MVIINFFFPHNCIYEYINILEVIQTHEKFIKIY